MKKVLLSVLFMMGLAGAASADTIVSGMGGMCLNVEGGLVQPGKRVIVWPCEGGANEKFKVGKPNGIRETRIYMPGTSTTAFDGSYVPFCLQSASRNDGSEIFIQPCDNNQTGLQNFAWRGGNTIGHNSGYCLDVRGGWAGWGATNVAGFVFGSSRNVPVILSRCHGDYNQVWLNGRDPRNKIAISSLRAGTLVSVSGTGGWLMWNGSSLVAAGAGNLVAAGAGNLVAAGGGNLVAAGGGNLVAAGGGN